MNLIAKLILLLALAALITGLASCAVRPQAPRVVLEWWKQQEPISRLHLSISKVWEWAGYTWRGSLSYTPEPEHLTYTR